MTTNEAAERLHTHEWTVARGPGWNSPYCGGCGLTLADALTAERRATVERIRSRFDAEFRNMLTLGEVKVSAILDEEAAR